MLEGPATGGYAAHAAAHDAAQTQNPGNVTCDLESPAAFDALLKHREGALRTLDLLPDTDLGRLRRLQILFAHDVTYPLADIEAELRTLRDVPVRGTLLMLNIADHLYEDALRINPDPRGISPLELEDASRAHAMVGVAALNLRRPHQALEHLRTAMTLARALGTTERLRAMELDWHRARVQIDEPDLDQLNVLMSQPLSERARHWGQRLKAQVLHDMGACDDALRALGPAAEDTADDAAQREYLHALLRLPAARVEGDPLLNPEHPYMQLTAAVHALNSGKRLKLHGLRGIPFESYGRLLEARALLNVKKVGGMGDPVLAILGETPPRAPGLAATWLVYRMQAALKAGRDILALRTAQELVTLAPRLREPYIVSGLLWQMAPDLLLALLMGTLGQHLNGISQLSLLVGQVVIYQGDAVKLPGRTGRATVLEAARHPETPEITRQERKRLSEVLRGFGGGRVMNAGGAMRYALTFYRAAHRAEDAEQVDLWRGVYERLYGMLSADVQCMFAPTPAQSLL